MCRGGAIYAALIAARTQAGGRGAKRLLDQALGRARGGDRSFSMRIRLVEGEMLSYLILEHIGTSPYRRGGVHHQIKVQLRIAGSGRCNVADKTSANRFGGSSKNEFGIELIMDERRAIRIGDMCREQSSGD